MRCGNALTKFRGVATRSARAALLFCLTVVSLPLGFAAPSVNRGRFSRRPFGVHPAGGSALKVRHSLAPPLGMASEPPVVNVVHAALKALRLRYFMDTKDWADHLSEAGVKCTANDLRNIVFGSHALKHVLGFAENDHSVYMRMTRNKRLYQVLDGGPCDESLRGLESPTPRSRFLRDAALRRAASAYVLEEKNRRTRASSGVYERRARSLTPPLPPVDGAPKDVADDVVEGVEGILALAAPATVAPALRPTTLPPVRFVGAPAAPSVVASAHLWLRALAPEPWTVRPSSGSSRIYLRFGDDDMTPVVTVRVEPASQGTVTVLAKVFDRRLDPKTRRPCGDDVSQTLGRDEFIDLLTRLGSATLCPGPSCRQAACR